MENRGVDLGVGCGDTLGTAMDRADPATIRGWLTIVVFWSWYAMTCLLQGKVPVRPNFVRAYLSPIWSGGNDHRYGKVRGGPQVFGGLRHAGWECKLGHMGPNPEERIAFRMRDGKRVAVGWTLRRPKSYRYEPRAKRWTTTETLAAIKDGGN